MTDTVTMPRSVVEQALDALQDANTMMEHRQDVKLRHSAMADLRAALEQPQVEQEPVAWIEHEWSGSGLRHLHFERHAPTVRDEVVRPVWTPLYPRPQPRQPLTDGEILMVLDAAEIPELPRDFRDVDIDIARAIERAVWEKSNG